MASPNISFDSIPTSIRKPGHYFEFNTRLAVRTLPGNLQRVLLVGQRLANATGPTAVPAGVAVEVFSDVDAAVHFGEGSIAHRMVKAAITANPYVQLTVIAVDDDDAAVAATGTITIAGTASRAGTLSVRIAGQTVRVAVESGDTVGTAATRLADEINAAGGLPVTAMAAQGVVTLTAKHKGAEGNNIKVAAVATAAGQTVTIGAMEGGTTDPDLDDALAAAFAAGHNIVVSPFATADALLALRAHLEAVGGPLEQRDAIGVAGTPGTLAAATTVASNINSGLMTLGWHSGSQLSAAEIGAAYASVIAYEEDPARPLNTLEIKGLDITDVEHWPSRTEQENALYNGVTPLETTTANRVQIVRAISTYTENAAGVPDVALLDITTMRTLHYVRKAVRERVALRFPREKLSERTPPKVRSEIYDVLIKLEELEIIEAVVENKDGLIVERDSQDVNRLNARIPADVVNGLHVFAGRIDLLL